MGCAYERELKAILSGDETTIEKVTRTGPADEADAYKRVMRSPFLVVRAAGSLGTADLVAMRHDVAFPIEVKSANRDVIHFSESKGALHEQALEMARQTARAGVLALYAFRRKGVRGGDAWRVFTLPTAGLKGRARLLYGRIPQVPETASGNFVLRWDEGLPLHKLLDYLCHDADPTPAPEQAPEAIATV